MLTATLNIELPSVNAPLFGRISRPARSKKQGANYTLLGLVILMHVIVALSLLMVTSKKVMPENTLTTMTVSLVSNPTSQQEAPPVEKKVEKIQKTKVEPTIPVKKQEQKSVMTKNEVAEKVIAESPSNQIAQETTQPNSPARPSNEVETTRQEPVVAEVKADVPVETEPPRFGAAYLNNPAPAYPQMARRLSQQGRVLLKVLVAENGTAETVELSKSSGFEKLDDAAIEAVKKWSFIPAKRSNQAVKAYVLVPVKFSLSN